MFISSFNYKKYQSIKPEKSLINPMLTSFHLRKLFYSKPNHNMLNIRIVVLKMFRNSISNVPMQELTRQFTQSIRASVSLIWRSAQFTITCIYGFTGYRGKFIQLQSCN